MIIIHGDNTVLSRKKLQEFIDKSSQKHIQIDRLEAKKLTPALLQESLGESSLFGEEKTIIIEELHSLPTSKRKKELIEMLSSYSDDQSSSIILYEKRPLTKTMTKKFTHSEQFEFKISNSLWQLLDSLGQSNKRQLLQLLRQAIDQNDPFFVYTMLIRQIRMLITAKENGKLAGAPFMITKLKKQAQQLSLPDLLTTHHQLHLIDIKQKNSQLYLELGQELDLLLFKM